MFKDWNDPNLTFNDFRHKWYVSIDPDSFALIAIAALETLLSEHEAVKEELAQANMRLASWPNVQQEPAAAVPSDEEIRKAIKRADSTTTPYAVGYLTEAIEMLAKRIGVKL